MLKTLVSCTAITFTGLLAQATFAVAAEEVQKKEVATFAAFGTVVAIGETEKNITLEQKDGRKVKFNVASHALVKVDGKHVGKGNLKQVRIGMKVSAMGERVPGKADTLTQVNAKKQKE